MKKHKMQQIRFRVKAGHPVVTLDLSHPEAEVEGDGIILFIINTRKWVIINGSVQQWEGPNAGDLRMCLTPGLDKL